ncbi:MAG: hypothetical protein NT069_15610 [Planctomycetota bacterium]|nr:hypothetical protein [Planctomycetota bacterium]
MSDPNETASVAPVLGHVESNHKSPWAFLEYRSPPRWACLQAGFLAFVWPWLARILRKPPRSETEVYERLMKKQ